MTDMLVHSLGGGAAARSPVARSSGASTADGPVPAGHDLRAVTLAAARSTPTAIVTLPATSGGSADWPAWVEPRVRRAIEEQGVVRLWRHQVEAAEAAHAGRHVVLATPTASGKSLAYWLPSLTAAVGQGATVLYCTATKALAQDQQARLAALELPRLNPACYDGDTDRSMRPWIRRSSRYVLTNPDMLHRSILPGHAQWRTFLGRLAYVVLDEAHVYRGIFGANVAAIVARLRRLCSLAGSAPTFVLSSATLGEPESSAAQLLGLPASEIVAVTEDTSARGARTVILLDPATAPAPARDSGSAQAEDCHDEGEASPAPVPSAFAETAAVLAAWVRAGITSVGFLRSRAATEAMAQQVRSACSELPSVAVTAYRGGLLPEERRRIEQRLRAGELRCVASTNALELGVDITGLDAVAMCGWPGTRLSFLQQLGRAGRRGEHAVAVLAAQPDPLDRYYVHHPDRVFGTPVEAAVLDRDNPYVLAGQIAAAIADQPLADREGAAWFGPSFPGVVAALASKGLVRRRGERWFWVASERAHGLSDLRGCGRQVTILEAGTGRVMGTVDGSSAPAQIHEGAVYIHLGVPHVVESLDLHEGLAVARPASLGYTTVARSVRELRIRQEGGSRPLGTGSLHHGEVEVTTQVVGYLRRANGTGRILGSTGLDLPAQRLVTRAAWWQLAADDLLAAGVRATAVPGAAHAAEHAAIGVLPALATCDRWDIGGLSTAQHLQTGAVTVFVYDGHPGGAGFARRAYEAAETWLAATRRVIATCECDAGCPGCVQSPKCGNGNEPLDKAGALALLDLLSPSG